jgi:hypothetical protein
VSPRALECPAAPQRGQRVGSQFRQREPGHIDERHPARKAFAALLDQDGRSAAENEKARGGARPIREDTEHGKEIGPALHLVKNHQAGQRPQDQSLKI